MNKSPLLAIKGLSVTYEKFGQSVQALQNLNLSVYPNEWIILRGTNGSGKSTLLKAIINQIHTYQGSILLNNQPLNSYSLKQRAALIFLVSQNPLLGTIPDLTIEENLLIADNRTHLKHTSKKDLLIEYQTLLEELHLAKYQKQLVGYLSGGQRQLLTLLIAKLRKPELVLLDEPFSALDPVNKALAISYVEKLILAASTVLHVSHDMNFQPKLKHRIITLLKGKVL